MTIALVGGKGSRLLAGIAASLRSECVEIDLSSALRGGELSLDEGRLVWDGFDLFQARAVFLERPPFAWPQAGLAGQSLSARAEREARALTVSALHALADAVRVVDAPAVAHLAVAPLAALGACAEAGLAVRPWGLALNGERSDTALRLDPAGCDPWLAPRALEAAEAAWSPEPFDGPVLSLLAVGEEVVGARRYGSAESWERGSSAGLLPRSELEEADCAAALAAARALQLSWLQVDLRAGVAGPEILRVQPGLELEAWDRDCEGAAASALAALLEV